MTYFKIVKIEDGRFYSAIAQNKYLVEYKLNEWAHSPFTNAAFGLFVTTDIAIALDATLGYTELDSDGIIHSDDSVYAVFECDIAEYEYPSPFYPMDVLASVDLSWDSEPEVSEVDMFKFTETKLVKSVKLTRQLIASETEEFRV